MKLRTEHGFSAVEALLIIVVIGVVGGVGYWVYSQGHKKTSLSTTNPTTSQAVKADGTTGSIDQLTQQDAASESGIDSKYQTTEQGTATSANQAAQNVGGAYNESTL